MGAIAALAEMPVTNLPRVTLPPPGRGLGEGGAVQDFSKDSAGFPPHPNPLPGGERGNQWEGKSAHPLQPPHRRLDVGQLRHSARTRVGSLRAFVIARNGRTR